MKIDIKKKKNIMETMAKVIQRDNIIKIGKEPVVFLPLKHWVALEERMEELENAVRFNKAFKESRGEKMITLEELRKKYKL